MTCVLGWTVRADTSCGCLFAKQVGKGTGLPNSQTLPFARTVKLFEFPESLLLSNESWKLIHI